MVSSDWYAVLGVKSTATGDEIRKAYRKKALQYHPDKNPSSTAEEIFKEINKAYETLNDVDKRRTFDLQQQKATNTRSASQQRPHEPSFHSFTRSHFPFDMPTHHGSSRFRYQDPFGDIHQRHARFASAFRSPNFAFFETRFGSSDDDHDADMDHFDRFPSPFHASHDLFPRKTRSKRNSNWPFDDSPFSMFEMLTRAVFDQFLSDDFLWPNSTSRLRSSSHQQSPSTTAAARTTSSHRTTIPVNHVTPTVKHRNDLTRTPASARYTSRESDEENVDEQFVYQQTKPTAFNHPRVRPRPAQSKNTKSNEQKLETCQYCFYPLTSVENLLKHESTCRHRPTQDKFYTTKCSYCHENICLSDYLDHEELCKQLGSKRTFRDEKPAYQPMAHKYNVENQSSSGPFFTGSDELRTCHRCQRTFPVLSDLFNHLCDDDDDVPSSKSTAPTLKSNHDKLFDDRPKTESQSPFDPMPSTSSKPFNFHRRPSFNNSSTPSSRVQKLISPLSPLSSPNITKRAHSTSRHTTPINSFHSNHASSETGHIPLFKRPLYQPTINTSNDKQHYASPDYINLRTPSSPMHVSS